MKVAGVTLRRPTATSKGNAHKEKNRAKREHSFTRFYFSKYREVVG